MAISFVMDGEMDGLTEMPEFYIKTSDTGPLPKAFRQKEWELKFDKILNINHYMEENVFGFVLSVHRNSIIPMF